MKMSIKFKNICAAILAVLLPGMHNIPTYAQIAPTAAVVSPAGTLHQKFLGTDSGSLSAEDKNGTHLGSCPLKHTDVSANISGYLANVTVKQKFENPFKKPIEAVYTFPLSTTGTVDEMVMKVGERKIHGMIKPREEAKLLYEAAKNRGQTASLLDQERPNIFTQSIANIRPGEAIEITLHYVDVLPYEAGAFSFAFPTVVGPRYMPGSPSGHEGTGWAPDTAQVPDASRISPPFLSEGTRPGHDLSLKVVVNAGIPIGQISSKLHDVDVHRSSANIAAVTLKDKTTIPNRDFVLTWQVATDKMQSGYLTHRDGTGKSGYFLLMMIPPKKVAKEEAAPKEMIFIVDRSGSQHGKPIEKAKETMNYVLDNMNPRDTFQVISFSNQYEKLFEKPQKASPQMIEQAKAYINGLQANGGTEMKAAVEEACKSPEEEHRLRIITMMTDGYIGNDFEIVGLVKKLRGNSRWFPFGTGNSVNRFLIDNIAKEGGGEADYVLLNDSAEAVAKKFYDRISSPALTDVKVEFQEVKVKDVYPRNVSDVWAQRPLFITGRYEQPGTGTAVLRGYAQGKPYQEKVKLDLPGRNLDNQVLGTIWARAQVDQLMSGDLQGIQSGQVKKELKDEIVRIALEHHIVTQFTSFVAIDETPGSKNIDKPIQVTVPVSMPDGVSGKYLNGGRAFRFQKSPMMGASPVAVGGGGFVQSFSRNGIEGKAMACRSAFAPKPLAVSIPSPTAAPEQLQKLKEGSKKESPRIEADAVGVPTTDASVVDARDSKFTVAPVELRRTSSVDHNKVRVRVKLKDLTKQTLQKLKEVGFTVLSVKTDLVTVIGKIDFDKLTALAKLSVVERIDSATP